MKKTLLFFLITALLLLLCSCHRTQTGSEDRQDAPASTPSAITNTEDAFTLVDSGTGPLQDEEQPTRVSHLEVCYFALPEEGTITAKVLRENCLIAAAQTQSGMKPYQMSFQQETRELALPDGANYITRFVQMKKGFGCSMELCPTHPGIIKEILSSKTIRLAISIWHI